ncbi:hypothetical protein EGW08_015993 [Elysia chlorotica]|uniref:Fibrinogen C-terminal domain-containing protein n=1 Tax=Elysia chlorotica TaxID=188477 RepID=A0A433T406_ELYCH|nr:hypothetical protein EGW08_015993 [Elysia chlorotica]
MFTIVFRGPETVIKFCPDLQSYEKADMALTVHFRLHWIFAAAFTLTTNGLQLNMHREHLDLGVSDACGRLICEIKGNIHTIETATVSSVKSDRTTNQLLTVSESHPRAEVVFGFIHGSGFLKENCVTFRVTLLKMAGCFRDELFYCQVTYVDHSGHRETAYTVSGQSASPSDFGASLSPVPVPGAAASFRLSELQHLAEKLSRAERDFASREDRLERKLGVLAADARQRARDMEARLDTRLAQATQTWPQGRGAVPGMERSPDLTSANRSLYAPAGAFDQVSDCVHGVGDDVTKYYPRYVVMGSDVIQKQILCDTHTDGGGWIVIQRRTRGDVNFYRDWTSYRQGFGHLTGDFWLGNEAIHLLTNSDAYKLRVDVRYKGQELFAEYSHFRIENESDKYRLRLGTYRGTAGDGLSNSNNQAFSTFDADNDAHPPANCAITGHGAWWYNACYMANLNGRWNLAEPEGAVWNWVKGQTPVSFSEMKIRRVKAPHEY